MGHELMAERTDRRTTGGLSQSGWLVPLCRVVALSSLTTGCTAILELDTEQCTVDTDCAELFGATSPYVCSEKVCTRPACDTDAQCKARGGSFATTICSEAEHLCSPGECTDIAQCGLGQTCDLTKNRCVQRECDTTEQCLQRSPSPTVQCLQGFCVDPTWGCIGQPDNRPRNPGETGTLKVKLLSSLDTKPIPNSVWKIKVCSPPQFDLNCASPLPVPEPQYDAETGTVTITGLSYETPIRIQFDETSLIDAATGMSILIPMDFYTQRPVVGVTEVPPVRVVSRAGLASLIESFKAVSMQIGMGEPVNPLLGNIYGLMFDCEDKPAGNVQLTYTNALGAALPQEPVVLYFDEQNIPSLTRRWSFPSGVFSSLNIPLENLNVATTLILDPLSTPIKTRSIRSNYSILLPSMRMTTVHFYPRAYTK